MGLGAQCWACRSRRVRCDSATPGCGPCIRRSIVCPGYSTTKPFRWVNKVTPESLLRSGPWLGSVQLTRGDDIAPASIVMDVVTYYNSIIAPDLAACAPTDHAISISMWLNLNISLRHLYTCTVAMHRTIRTIPEDQTFGHSEIINPMHKDLVMFHHHQTCAARLLYDQIEVSSGNPDGDLFSCIIAFMSSSIQQSAFGIWRSHLNGARVLLNLWGIPSLLGSHNFVLYTFIAIDIFGMTTAPSSFLTTATIKQQLSYMALIRTLQIDSWGTLTPIPDELLVALAAANVHRVGHVHGHAGIDTSVTSILAFTQSFCPEKWAVGVCGTPSSNQLLGWILLARCFQGAVSLYLLLSSSSNSNSLSASFGEPIDIIRTSTYTTLLGCIHNLFDRRGHGEGHHKFLLWPMAITGVEAVARHDRTELDFLCHELRYSTMSLGTMAMREAAAFLEHLWTSTWSDLDTSVRATLDWNVVFQRAPIFVM